MNRFNDKILNGSMIGYWEGQNTVIGRFNVYRLGGSKFKDREGQNEYWAVQSTNIGRFNV